MGRKAARPPPSEASDDDYEAPPPRKGNKAAPESDYGDEEEESPRGKAKGSKPKRAPSFVEEEEEEEEEDDDEEDDDDDVEEKLTMSEKYDRFMESLSPGMKMIYTMISAAFTLVIITVFGGLVFYDLERKLALSLNVNYMAFMAQLEQTLMCVGNSTNPVAGTGNCTNANGPAMYQSLIDNYMQDPSTLVDVWGPTTDTLYLFAFTIVSTIGYGTFAPKTAGGQIFTIFYALFSIPVGGVLLGKLAGTLLELGEWMCYSTFSGRIKEAYNESNKSGDGILDYDDMRMAIQKAQGHEIDPGDFNNAVKESDKFETHEIDKPTFAYIYLKVDKEEMQECRGTDRAKVCSLLVLGWLLLGMRYFGQAEGWTMVESFYFGIVTLTTIGFGDYVPTTPKGTAFHFLFCIFGLGLVATLLGALSAMAAGGGDAPVEHAGGKDGDGDDDEDAPKMVNSPSVRRKSRHKSGLAGQAAMQEGAARRRRGGKAGKAGKPGKRAPSTVDEEEDEEEEEDDDEEAPPPPVTPSSSGPFGLPPIDFGWLGIGGAPAPPPPPAPVATKGRKPVREESDMSSIAPSRKRGGRRDEEESLKAARSKGSPKSGRGGSKGGKGRRMDADL